MRRSLLTAALAVSLLAGGAPALASGIPPGKYAIGDSVMLGAKPALRARGFTVNAVKSRQFYEAVSIVRRKKDAAYLSRRRWNWRGPSSRPLDRGGAAPMREFSSVGGWTVSRWWYATGASV